MTSLNKRLRKSSKSLMDLKQIINIKKNNYKGPLFTIKERKNDDFGESIKIQTYL